MTSQQAEGLKHRIVDYSEFIKLFSGEQQSDFIAFIRNAIGTAPALRDSVEAFATTAFKASPTLSELCKWLAKDLANAECSLLGPAPVTLTSGQREIFSKYKSLINQDDSRVLLIQGQSGSGKSLIALLMLTYALAHKKRTTMTLVNAHLLEVLVKQMRPYLPVVQNLIINLGTQNPRRTKRFGFLANSSSLDVLICDEGQRTSAEDIEALMSPDRAQLTVIFFDERQRLLPNEGGTKSRFLSAAKKQKRNTLFKELGSSIRCEGGPAYIQFIESLVYAKHLPLRQSTDTKTWQDRYEFRIFSSVEAMREELRVKHEREKASIALLASYTKTDGSAGEQKTRWKDPLIKWRMKGEYGDFWLREGNAKLDTCASIYGSQGLEAHYIGLLCEDAETAEKLRSSL